MLSEVSSKGSEQTSTHSRHFNVTLYSAPLGCVRVALWKSFGFHVRGLEPGNGRGCERSLWNLLPLLFVYISEQSLTNPPQLPRPQWWIGTCDLIAAAWHYTYSTPLLFVSYFFWAFIFPPSFSVPFITLNPGFLRNLPLILFWRGKFGCLWWFLLPGSTPQAVSCWRSAQWPMATRRVFVLLPLRR